MFRIDFTPGDSDRDGFGGRPYLRDGKWPVCTHEAVLKDVVDDKPTYAPCTRLGQPMTHFLRFDIRAEWQTPFAAGSHFSLFHCVACADAFIPPTDRPPPWQMPARFWESTEIVGRHCNYGWWYAALEPPGAPLVRAASAEPLLVEQSLAFVRDDDKLPSVGGKPRWLQGAEGYVCPCGAAMALVVQLPENFPFPTTPGAPEQRGTYSKKRYKLFLGNAVYMFACPKGCDPRSVLPVNQS
jgi:hypothetical protein